MPERIATGSCGHTLLATLVVMAACLCGTALAAEPVFVGGQPQVEPTFMPRQETHAVQQGNVLLTTVLARGGQPFDGSRFTILREEPDAWGKTRLVTLADSGPQAIATFSLNPGRYRLQVRNGAVLHDDTIEVPKTGMLRRDVVLGAGVLALHSVMSAAGTPADESWFRVLREDTSPYGDPQVIQIAGNGYADDASFLLPAGHYVAEARCGNASRRLPVLIEPGVTSTHHIDLGAGRLELFATLAPGGDPVAHADFSVTHVAGRHAPLTGADGPITAIATDTAAFVLPAGSYRVRAQNGDAAIETTIEVTAGSSERLELPLDAGELSVMATLAGTDELLLNAEFIVEAIINPRSPAVEIARAGPVHRAQFVLPRGRYLVRARIGDTEQRREIELQAADRASALIEMDAGRVALQMVRDENDEPLGYTWFSVYRVERDGSQRRRVFNDGYFNERELILPEGRYVAFGRHRHLAGETDFEVRAGEFSRVAIVAH
ncbi:MAG: hypothetical protein KDI88_15185 [Gammaproteobacteria bacterium]|nr:hypothetical protein [Gammaproteobacteria bacterium]